MVKPRRVALVFLVLAALLAVAWFSRARWLADLLAGLTSNATAIGAIENLVSIFVPLGSLLLFLLGIRDLRRAPSPAPPPAPEEVALVLPISLEALRVPFSDVKQQAFQYIDRGATRAIDLLAQPRLVIVGRQKVGKSREAVELIARAREYCHIPPERIFAPTENLLRVAPEAIAAQIRRDVPGVAPLLLFLDDLPRAFQGEQLTRLAAALTALQRSDLHVVATARADQLDGCRDWLAVQAFTTVTLPPWTRAAITGLVDDGIYLTEAPVDEGGREALIAGNDGTPELARLTLLGVVDEGRGDRAAVAGIQKETLAQTWAGRRRALVTARPAVAGLLRAAAIFHLARVTPYTDLIVALAAGHTPNRRRAALAALDTLVAAEAARRDGDRLRVQDYVAEGEGLTAGDARAALAQFLLGYRRWLRFPGLRRLYAAREQHANALFGLALAAGDEAAAEARISYYTAAIGFRPFSWYYNNRGVLHDNHGRPDDALADYGEAIRLDPTNAAAFYNRGLLQGNHGRPDEALADYNEAIRLDPTYAKAFNNRGLLHDGHGRSDEALADYSEAIRLDPTYAAAFTNRGLLLRQLGRVEEAIDDLETGARLGPDTAGLHLNLAGAYKDAGRHTAAAGHIALARERLAEDDLYDRACLEAIDGNDHLALDLLAQALAAGQIEREWVRRDPDWKPLRDHARFRELTGEP